MYVRILCSTERMDDSNEKPDKQTLYKINTEFGIWFSQRNNSLKTSINGRERSVILVVETEKEDRFDGKIEGGSG